MENYLIGARPTYEGLVIEPHLPFDKASMKREFRGATYEIEISNPEKKYKNVTVLVSVDGKAIDGNIVPSFADGKTHKVTVNVK